MGYAHAAATIIVVVMTARAARSDGVSWALAMHERMSMSSSCCVLGGKGGLRVNVNVNVEYVKGAWGKEKELEGVEAPRRQARVARVSEITSHVQDSRDILRGL